ncbi:MAG: hypothetical protein ACLFVP_09480 [Candidatus Bathyarchaeia archaeon]
MMETVEQLIFDVDDFKFNTAYREYQEAFNTADNDEEKIELNEMLTDLSEDKISYPEFYKYLRGRDQWYRFHRTQIKTSRKYAYRKKQQKKARIERHK